MMLWWRLSKISFLPFLILSLIPRMSFSEPDSIIRQLTGEPVTLLDQGLSVLDDVLRNLEISEEVEFSASAYYDKETNIISIIIMNIDLQKGEEKRAKDILEAKEWAKTAVAKVRQRLGAYSEAKRTVIPTERGHSFRRNADTDSDGRRTAE